MRLTVTRGVSGLRRLDQPAGEIEPVGLLRRAAASGGNTAGTPGATAAPGVQEVAAHVNVRLARLVSLADDERGGDGRGDLLLRSF